MRVRLMLPLVAILTACAPATPREMASRAQFADSTLPPMKAFATSQVTPPERSNRDLALDFIELSFQLESGRQLPVFTRFEGPITVRVTGTAPGTLGPDLKRLITRLRREAGIDIALTTRRNAGITIEAVSRKEIRQMLPQAACFVAPNVGSLQEYRAARRKPHTDWTILQRRDRIAIFVPNDASPQEVRDCLHEELAQAIGPLNDLYRLPDSVFNDDNVHTVLTGFDMLILRAYYDPALRSGMTRGQVAAALPLILARIHPAGERRQARLATRTPRAWSEAIQTALGRSASFSARVNAANRAIRVAASMGWTDHRRAFSHYALGRVLQARDPQAAYAHYLTADSFYGKHPDAALHRAYVGTRLAAYAVTRADGEEALRLIAPHIRTARVNENAALLATLLLLRAEALEQTGRIAEARSVRLDSIGWARYGFGADWAVRAKLSEIASLNPLKG
ncbi:MAG: DUF2927 domain-containing protein [Sulfitobacter sp.]|nr:DUF2927 domain-containing protein [Sulfitobacter sp.]